MRNILLLTLFISLVTYAQPKIEIPVNYKQIEIPKDYSEDYRKLNYAEDFSIYLKDNKIEIFKTPRKKDSELKFKNGLLIGSDHGEWGGKLVYKSADKEISIKDGNIISIFEYKEKVYFLEGLAHMNTNYGEIYEVENTKDKFTYKKVLELPDEPEAFEIFNNKIYIATYENFLIIDNWKIEKKIKGFWGSLYPNSLIIENDNHIFMGIRGGIVELKPKDKIIKLYAKTN
jgi:hypothetical protein